MSKFVDPEKQAMEDFRQEVSAGLGLPVWLVFGEPEKAATPPEVLLKQDKQRREKVLRHMKRGLAKLKEAP